MKMDKVANSGNDEYYTPEYAIIPILKYLKPQSRIWCPFDTSQSNFKKMLEEAGHTVVTTHIENEQDFFELIQFVVDYDYIISNPPYSLKTEVLEALFNNKRPFAMLVGVVGIFESKKRFNMFKENDFEIMYFDKRISYFKNYDDPKPSINPPFSSVYICHDILPTQVVFENIIK